MENLYTETQVKELLRQQRINCAVVADREGENEYLFEKVDFADEPEFPTPIQAIPVEKVKDVVDKIDKNSRHYLRELTNKNVDTNVWSSLMGQYTEGQLIIKLLKEKLLTDGTKDIQNSRS